MGYIQRCGIFFTVMILLQQMEFVTSSHYSWEDFDNDGIPNSVDLDDDNDGLYDDNDDDDDNDGLLDSMDWKHDGWDNRNFNFIPPKSSSDKISSSSQRFFVCAGYFLSQMLVILLL